MPSTSGSGVLMVSQALPACRSTRFHPRPEGRVATCTAPHPGPPFRPRW